jgi:hypothetical protein
MTAGFHEETGDECFEWYSAEELQRHSILRVFGRSLSSVPASSSALVYRVLDVGAGTSGTSPLSRGVTDSAFRRAFSDTLRVCGVLYARVLMQSCCSTCTRRCRLSRSESDGHFASSCGASTLRARYASYARRVEGSKVLWKQMQSRPNRSSSIGGRVPARTEVDQASPTAGEMPVLGLR